MLKKIGGFLLVIICFFAAKFAVEFVMAERNESAVANTISEISAIAEVRNPGATAIEASETLGQVASEKAAELIASKGTNAEKRTTAIDTFAGFLFVNVISRPEYCRKFGVEIPVFVEAFTSVHQEEISVAKANGVNMDTLFRDSEYVKAISSGLRQVIERDMKAIQQEYGLSEAESCEALNEAGVELAQEMLLSKMQPEVYNAIHLE